MSGVSNPTHWLGTFLAPEADCRMPSCEGKHVFAIAVIAKAEILCLYLCQEHRKRAEDFLKKGKKFPWADGGSSKEFGWLPGLRTKDQKKAYPSC